jgi:hypothetical protein
VVVAREGAVRTVFVHREILEEGLELRIVEDLDGGRHASGGFGFPSPQFTEVP